MIYFVQPVSGGPVKIGTTINLESRLKQLESHYGQPLAVLATQEGGRTEEAEIHARFSHLRFGHTEQFKPAPELMDFIGRPLLVNPDPSAVESLSPADPSKRTISMRVSGEYALWVDELAAKSRNSTAGLLDQAMVAFAKEIGFEEEPPIR